MHKAITFDDLAPIAARIRAFVERNAEASSKTEAGRTSEFWSEIFDARGNFPDINQLLVCRRESNTSGIDTDTLGSIEEEKAYSDQTYHLFRRLVPRDYAASLQESTFGAPYSFEHDGLVRSSAFWMQCTISRKVLDCLAKFGTKRPLRVLEIGAGMGMCLQHLHAKADVESYTIVDLPENIYISGVGLSTILPDRRIELHEMEGPSIDSVAPGTINFCLPGTIARLNAKFDLVVNSFSLQEMSLGNVNAYIDWIETVLSDEGIFVSMNSHAKAGVRQPSDYRWNKFHLHHWATFRQTPLAYFNTIPYEVVVGKRRATSPVYADKVQNGIGWLMQLGLDGDLKPFFDGLVAGNLSAEQVELLGHYADFFAARSDADRDAALGRAEKFGDTAVFNFVKANYHFARDETGPAAELLKKAKAQGLADFARVRASVLLSAMARRQGQTLPLESLDGLDIATGYPDAFAIVQNGDLDTLVGQLNHILGRSVPRPLHKRIGNKLARLGKAAG